MKTDRTSIKKLKKLLNHQNLKTHMVVMKFQCNSLLSSPFISSHLKCIRNKSLPLYIFPVRLKYSEIQPLFKNITKIITDPCLY